MLDLRNEKISYKVREHSSTKTPVILVLGKKEQESNSVSIRRIGSNNNESMSLKEAIKEFSSENVKSK